MAKKVAVPSLVGTTEDSALTTLTDAGLTVVKRYVAGEPDGIVYSQSPGKVAKGEGGDHRRPSSARGGPPGRSERCDQVHR